MQVYTNTYTLQKTKIRERAANSQSVMYFDSAAGSGGILAGGGPFLIGRLGGLSLNWKVVGICNAHIIHTIVLSSTMWYTTQYIMLGGDLQLADITLVMPI